MVVSGNGDINICLALVGQQVVSLIWMWLNRTWSI